MGLLIFTICHLKKNNSITIISNLFRTDGYYYKIFDISGRQIVDLPISKSGFSYWNGTDTQQVNVPNGNYFIVLQSGDGNRIIDTVQISLIK